MAGGESQQQVEETWIDKFFDDKMGWLYFVSHDGRKIYLGRMADDTLELNRLQQAMLRICWRFFAKRVNPFDEDMMTLPNVDAQYYKEDDGHAE